jgi:gluconolactonase
MYAAPPSVKAEIFARIPDKFRKAGQLSVERLTAGKGTLSTDCFIEGPSFDRQGNLYIVDIAFGRVFKIRPSGEVDVVAEWDGEPNGLKIHQDGRIFVTDHKCGLLLINPDTGHVTPVIERYMTERFRGLNDLYIAKNGSIYFTDQGQSNILDPTGRVYRMNPDGRVEKLFDHVPSPNGIVMSPNERQLYVAVTRTNSIWKSVLSPDDGLTRTGLFIQMSGGTGPDGMAIDQASNLVVAHAGGGKVWLFSPMGEPLLRINAPAGHMTTNVAYGGPDNKNLYITESDTGCVLVTKMEVPGQLMHSHL